MLLKKIPLKALFALVLLFTILLMGIILVKLPGSMPFSFPWRETSSISPDILDLTNPVHFVRGTVISSDGEYIDLRLTRQDTASELIPDEDMIIRFRTKPTTEVYQNPSFLPYAFRNPQDAPPKPIVLSVLKPGYVVTVATDTDMRTYKSGDILLNAVYLLAGENRITGMVTQRNGDSFTVMKERPVNRLMSQDKKLFTIRFLPETEFSLRYSASGIKQDPEEITYEDVRVNDFVAAYAGALTPNEDNMLTAEVIHVFRPGAEPGQDNGN